MTKCRTCHEEFTPAFGVCMGCGGDGESLYASWSQTVDRISQAGITQAPGLLSHAVRHCIDKRCFKSDDDLKQFVADVIARYRAKPSDY